MSLSLILFLLLGHIPASSNDSYLHGVRSNYIRAANDKKLCSKMIQELAKTENNTTLLAYLGGFKAIWAKHTINPIHKLSTFKEGTKLIEKAVKDDQQNIEVRFVRLSVQKNCPFFLNYKKNINDDIRFIKANKNNIGSTQLKDILELVTNEQ